MGKVSQISRNYWKACERDHLLQHGSILLVYCARLRFNNTSTKTIGLDLGIKAYLVTSSTGEL